MCVLALGCDPEDPELQPDLLLQQELGLTLEDRVHRVKLTGGSEELVEPPRLSVVPGEYVEFVTMDWLIHEVIFQEDSVGPVQWRFLEGTDQIASPPLLQRDSRFLLAFEGAPLGRYPYTVEGNGRSGGGVIEVVDPDDP